MLMEIKLIEMKIMNNKNKFDYFFQAIFQENNYVISIFTLITPRLHLTCGFLYLQIQQEPLGQRRTCTCPWDT